MELSQYLNVAPVACVIFALTIAVSAIAFSSDWVYENFILHPASVYHGKGLHTLITSGFIHADLMHLFFNMFSFYFFAFTLEGILGHWQFALLYSLSLILSDLPTVARYKDNYNYRSLGASGAISAVLFSFILFNPFMPLGLMFVPGLNIWAAVFGVLYLFYCSYASKRQLGNINHDAHLFGAISGIMITIVMRPHVVVDFAHQITEKVQSLLH